MFDHRLRAEQQADAWAGAPPDLALISAARNLGMRATRSAKRH
jgi:hypothetical protein